MKAAPLFFATSLLLGGGAGYWLCSHEDKDHMQHTADLLTSEQQGRKNEVALLEQRLGGKDDLLNDYRERLYHQPLSPTVTVTPEARVPAKSKSNVHPPPTLTKQATSLSKLDNTQLQSSALDLVSQIRTDLGAYHREDRSLSPHSPEEYKTYVDKSVRLSTELTDGYKQKYQIRAVLLRDELLSRIPEGSRPPKSPYDDYLLATNPLVVEDVCASLEKLARLLPTPQ